MDMAAKSRKGAAPRRQRCWASLGLGLLLAAIALAAMLIDLRNNYAFGAAISFELGLVMALAAVALTALPAAAALLGRWDNLLRAGTVLAVLLTVLAAVSAYSEKQGEQILSRQGASAAYEQALADAADARREMQSARAEAAAIAETSTPAQLRLLVTEGEAKAEREADRKGCGPKCEAAKAEHVALIARLGQAQAKASALARADAAQVRLDDAKVAAKGGPAEVSMLATMIAGQTGHRPEDIARTIALGTTGFSIAVTLVMALLMHQATALIMKGLAVTRQDQSTAPARMHEPRPAAQPIAAQARPATADALIQMFIAEVFQPGGQATAGQIYEAFEAWWSASAPGVRVPSQVALSKALVAAGLAKQKKGGRMVYDRGLVH